jgi:hypothetical protein
MLQNTPLTPSALDQGLTAITHWIKNWGIPLAGIGTLSMALIQTAKNIFSLRRNFQEKRFKAWLESRNQEAFTAAESDLIALTTAGDQDAFYNSDIDVLCGEIKNTLTSVLDYPQLHKAVIACLASSAGEEDLQHLFHPPHSDAFLKPANQSTPEERQAVRQYAIAKTRIGAEMRCAVDAIQNSVAFRWKKTMQIASLFVSAAVGVIALQVGARPSLPPTLGASIVIGLLAGFLAPVARDLVAAIESWRNN